MRKLFTLALLLAVPACIDFDMTGLEGLDDYATELAGSAEPDFLQCSPPEVAVGEGGVCHAFNAAGTHLVYSDIAPLIWESSAPTVVTVTMDGAFFGGSPGTASVIARGPNGSQAALLLTVN